MSKHFAEGQYDDDLTIGVDEFDNDILFDEVDLLKYKPSESPLAKLKSLILSIDWEITDDILREFNEELLSLREMWQGEKIYLVYIQALETISKYIYQQKSSAHPNAVKLLPAFYYNFEKIVVDDTLTDDEKQEILLSDVKRFNHLKGQLIKGKKESAGPDRTGDVLQNLKTLVLSIDWEITADDLDALRQEVLFLDHAFRKNKPKLKLLQGLGTLAAYIRHKGSNSHADAFTLLHSFFVALEKVSNKQLTLQEEKEILFAEVDKFNAFKATIATTLSPEALSRDADDLKSGDISSLKSDDVQPAFADVAPDAVMGFQEEHAANDLDPEEDLTSRLENFFADDEPVAKEKTIGVGEALQFEESFVSAHQDPDSVAIEAESRLDDFFDNEVFSADMDTLDTEVLLQGVNVETDADDDSDEEALPFIRGEIAPALSENDETSSFRETDVAVSPALSSEEFFNEESEFADTALSFIDESDDFGEALSDIESGFEEDAELDEMPFVYEGGELAPALADFAPSDSSESEIQLGFADQLGIENTLDAFFDDFAGEETGDVKDDDSTENASLVAPQVGEQVDLLKEYFDESDSEEESIDDSIDQFFGFDEEEVAPSEIDLSVDSYEENHALFEPVEEEILEFEESADSSPASLFGFADEEKDELATIEKSDTEARDAVDEEIPQALFSVEETSISEFEGKELVFEPVEEDFVEVDLAIDGEPVLEESLVFVEVDESIPEDIVEENLSAIPAISNKVEVAEAADIFENLRSSIQSLGIEIETPVLAGVFAEINRLRQKLVAEPLAKSFLQLLSTVTQHIDQYRYECSGDAYTLLLSIFEELETVDKVSAAKGQELLLGKTYKVLQWQQNMLVGYRNLLQRESEIVVEEIVETQFIFDEQPQVDEDLLLEGEDELIYAGLEDELADEKEKSLSSIGVDDIRSELQSLRKTLQGEIAQLRAELLQK